MPLFIKSGITSSDFPTKNSALSILFSFVLSFALSIASFIISTPYTFLAFCDKNKDIVPVPQ